MYTRADRLGEAAVMEESNVDSGLSCYPETRASGETGHLRFRARRLVCLADLGRSWSRGLPIVLSQAQRAQECGIQRLQYGQGPGTWRRCPACMRLGPGSSCRQNGLGRRRRPTHEMTDPWIGLGAPTRTLPRATGMAHATRPRPKQRTTLPQTGRRGPVGRRVLADVSPGETNMG